MKVDILVFGVHPDDMELGCAGTVISAIAAGKKVAIIDLTQGELGTRGTIETRYKEAANAAKIMGVHARENLKMRDGFFVNDETHQLQIIQTIRKYQPTIILSNAPDDRHPDHGRSSKLISDAAFLSGLRKIETTNEQGKLQEPWKPSYIFNYIQDKYIEPSFVVDISAYHEQKIKAILCYQTQFHNPEDDSTEPATYISSPQFLDTIKGRASIFGKRIGVQFAEGFISEKWLGIQSFDAFISNPT
jgi:N-acetylglucosamine malate deacetylase 1